MTISWANKACAIGLMLVFLAAAEQSPAQADNAVSPPAAGRSSERLQNLLTDIVRQNIPHEFEEIDNWGATKDFTVGVDVSLDGLRLDSERRRKALKHGTWKMYRVKLVDPQQQFQIRAENLRELKAGKAAFDVLVEARLDAFGRIAEWRRGVQLFTLSANADALVRMRLACELSSRLDARQFPPAIQLQPVVKSADLELVEFRLTRISDLDGPAVKELGKALRDVLEDKIEDQRDKTAEKINREIAKNSEVLRLSLPDLMQTELGRAVAKQAGATNAEPPSIK